MKLKLFVVTMTLGLSSLAQAEDYDLEYLVVPDVEFYLANGYFFPGSFTDTWRFDVLADTYLTATITDLAFYVGNITFKNMDALSVKLYDSGNELITNLSYNIGSSSDVKMGSWLLPAGGYSFKVSGKATGNIGGLYTLGLATGGTMADFTTPLDSPVPVPEPETYAMLLAGLGVLGAVTRRRMKSA